MKKLLFRKFLKDHISQFLFFSFSLTIIVWVIQAVNFLDFVTEDGHGLATYFSYTIFNLPKVFHRLLPFLFFLSLFYQLIKYEDRNELLIFWSHGIDYKKFINVIVLYSFIFMIFQIILASLISPKSQDMARSFIRDSNIDFFPNLIKEKKFIDVMSGLTIFAEKKNSNNTFSNITLSESKISKANNEIKIITAKKGNLISNNDGKYFELTNGKVIEINSDKVTNFSFDKIIYSLQKYKSKTTTYQKFQELPTIDLIKCIENYYILNKQDTKIGNLFCHEPSIDDTNQELLKRLFKPFYIPLIAIICCLILFISKESINFKKKRLYIFFFCFMVLTYSELLLRYSGKNIFGFALFTIIPILVFLIIYIYSTLEIKIKKNFN
tara:strand:+ start:37 stop:1179 length:1143 start_codon:yes stop_codon:yes gene_type:complete